MKLNLFLSLVSAFTAFHLCKAGPLRLHKRAAFYIANETACVVDNIVYSNGEPIPTDDPCESCKCRPPGFACVLTECRIKPGCRAIRHVGECCPEYLCGCEHGGRMYQDGEEIRDPKNPCYICHCQGSSIACAFVDCFFRDDCDTVFEPGECCPKYTNCSRDVPENPLTDNGLPPINLLPALNDESILPQEYPHTTQAEEISKITSDNPTQPPQPTDNVAETLLPKTEESNEPKADEPASFVTEETKLDPEVDAMDAEVDKISNEATKDLLKDEDKDIAEITDETKILLHSETAIKTDEFIESTEVNKNLPETIVEVINEGELQTTIASKLEENEAKVTEKSTEIQFTNTEIPEANLKIKNSASENGKSLKLSGDDQSKNSEEKDFQNNNLQKTKDKLEETGTELLSELTSEVQTVESKGSSTEEKKLESDENIAEESQANPQSTSFYNNEKIKSESAESDTIIVHDKKEKITTETDFVSERPVSLTSPTQENLLQSTGELVNADISKDISDAGDNESTGKNFEVFPTSTEIRAELTSNLPTTEKNSEEIQGRSAEDDSTALETEHNHESEKKLSDIKSENSSVETTTNEVSAASKEGRTDEVTDNKMSEPTVTVSRIDLNEPVRTEMTAETQKTEESTKEPLNEPKETKSEKPVDEGILEVREDNIETEERIEEIKEISTPIKETTSIANQESTSVQENGKSTPIEKMEESTAAKMVEETTTVKVQESTLPQTDDKPQERSEETELQNNEKTNSEDIRSTEIGESKSQITTESLHQGTEKSKHTEIPSAME